MSVYGEEVDFVILRRTNAPDARAQMRRHFRSACSSLSNSLPREFSPLTSFNNTKPTASGGFCVIGGSWESL